VGEVTKDHSVTAEQDRPADPEDLIYRRVPADHWQEDAEGNITLQSSAFSLSSSNYGMSVGCGWVDQLDEEPLRVLKDYPGQALVSVPRSVVEEHEELWVEVDGDPDPWHGNVFRGRPPQRKLSTGMARLLKRRAAWVVSPSQLGD